MKQLIAVIVTVSLFLGGCSVVNIINDPLPVQVNTESLIKIHNEPIALAPLDTNIRISKLRLHEANCLAKVIYYEARGESKAGKIAVGNVVVNRTTDPQYPSTVCEVVKQSTIINHKRYCQFSWYCDGDKTKLYKALDNPMYKDSLDIALNILSGKITNIVPSAISFHANRAKHVSREWTRNGMKKLVVIGNHTFYGNGNSGS